MTNADDNSIGSIARPRSDLRLWIGMLLPPAAWAVHLQSIYLTSELGCNTADLFWNHVVTGVCFVFAVIGTVAAAQAWRSLGEVAADGSASPQVRKKFMAIIGVLGGAFFAMVILAQWLPSLLGVPCGK
jgi:hypothetical protein